MASSIQYHLNQIISLSAISNQNKLIAEVPHIISPKKKIAEIPTINETDMLCWIIAFLWIFENKNIVDTKGRMKQTIEVKHFCNFIRESYLKMMPATNVEIFASFCLLYSKFEPAELKKINIEKYYHIANICQALLLCKLEGQIISKVEAGGVVWGNKSLPKINQARG